MKFLCDRCKTRYSIADERVRGKILKIRCKNCANVISVREGMTDEELAAAEPAAAPATSALQSAFASVMSQPGGEAPPPASLDEEWYVSIDGVQSGPFSLAEAQAWVGQKQPGDELFCWCEGFDDWLPVEKVSHFRGLRALKETPRPRSPTRRPETAAPAGARRDGSRADRLPAATPAPAPVSPPVVEEEPKPLFAATLAKLEAEAGGAAEPSRPVPRAELAPTVPAERDRADSTADPGRAETRPDKPALPEAAARAADRTGGAAKAAAAADRTGGAAKAAAAAAADRTGGAAKAAAAKEPAAAGLTPLAPVAPRAPLPLPRTGAAPSLPRAGGQVGVQGAVASAAPIGATAAALATAPAAPALTPALAPTPAVSEPARAAAPAPAVRPSSGTRPPKFDTGEAEPDDGDGEALDDSALEPDDDDGAAGAAARGGDGTDGLDLDIGEVSRVVRLPDLAAMAAERAARAPVARPVGRASGAAQAIGRVTAPSPAIAASQSGNALGVAPALGADALPPLSDAVLADAQPQLVPTMPPRRSHHTMWLIGGTVLLLGVILVAVVVASSAGTDTGPVGTGGGFDTTGLGYTIDDPRRPHLPGELPGSGSNPGSGSGTGARVRPHGNGSSGTTGGSQQVASDSGSNGSGRQEIGPDGQPILPLTGDDIVNVSQKMSIGTGRCYDRALKDDPFLKVAKIQVTLKVDASGVVTDVSLDSHSNDKFGQCLIGAIRRWPFRRSTEGINTVFPLVFQQGP